MANLASVQETATFLGFKMEKNVYPIIPAEENATDSKTIRRMINKIQNIIRDSDANSNIITRFDEISKLLFIKLYAEQTGEAIFQTHFRESLSDYAKRIQQIYASALEAKHLKFSYPFNTILLSDEVIVKCGKELLNINMSTAGVDVKGFAYEETIKGTFDKNDNQQYFTPYQIASFMVEMMSDFMSGTVCDPACGTAGFLTTAGSQYDISLLGLEVDERLAWVSNLNLFIHGKNDFEVCALPDGGSLGLEAHKYFGTIDAVLTNPPFGSDYTDTDLLSNFALGSGRSSRRRGILFIEQAWNFLKENGAAAIIIDQGVLNSESNNDVRKYILEHYNILAIIDLPETAFLPYANVNSSILFLKKVKHPVNDRVFYGKAANIGRKSNGDDDLIYLETGEAIPNSDLPDIIEQWKLFNKGITDLKKGCYIANLAEHLAMDDSKRLDYVYHHPFRNESAKLLEQANYPLFSLAELCNERNESYIPAADPDAITIPFTGLANIESYTGKAVQNITPAASIKSSVKRYEAGDIIFSKMRPALRKIAVVNFNGGGFVSSECAVFTVKKNENNRNLIDPLLLSAILRSDYVYGQIMGCVTGIGRPRIGMKDLRKIKIPVPPADVQKKALLSLKAAQKSAMQLRKKAELLSKEATTMERNAINDIAQIMSGEKNG